MQDPERWARFKSFATSLLASEGIEFLDAVSQNELSTEALAERYLLAESPRIVSLPSRLASEIDSVYSRRDTKRLLVLIQEISRVVYLDLKNSDTFRSFRAMDTLHTHLQTLSASELREVVSKENLDMAFAVHTGSSLSNETLNDYLQCLCKDNI